MKLSEYITGLQEFLKDNGDLECFYARDSEGNGFYPVYYTGTCMFKNKKDSGYIDALYSDEDLLSIIEDNDESVEDYEKICVVN